jgi:Flp pilus assembly protein TadD
MRIEGLMATERSVAMNAAIETICNHLTERTATLFLGAGINAGVRDSANNQFPLGAELSKWIARDLLETPDLTVNLDDSAEMARFRLGPKVLNDYIFEKFSSFKPGVAHLALAQLPWDAVYTTNYDLLVEAAYGTATIAASGTIRQVYSAEETLNSFSEEDIPYYKLHGSADYANTDYGRLVLTREDYRFYETHRKPLFARLKTDLLSKTFVFVGYSLSDDNFRAILEDCKAELQTASFPLSFAVKHSFTATEEAFWKEKYNIQLIEADSAIFMDTLKSTWIAEDLSVLPLLKRKASEYLTLDESTTRFQKVGDSFYLVRAADCTGPANTKPFFNGAEASWGTIRDGIAPKRDVYWLLLDSIFSELVESNVPPSLYLLTGAAGTGKSTLLKSICYDLSKDFSIPVLMHIPGTPLDTRVLGTLVNPEKPERIVIVIRNAAEYVSEIHNFMEDAVRKKLPVTVLLEERRNQWTVANATRNKLIPAEFELGSLSDFEIESILDALSRHGALGRLTGTTREEQLEHFKPLADRELLVALRELTSVGSSFDEIIRNEYDGVPSESAKQAYLYVSAFGQLGLSIRYETLVRLFSLRYDQLGPEILAPTEGVLMVGEQTGHSRHTIGYRLSARHPVIASVIFDHGARTDDEKFKIINDLLTNLDPGFSEDNYLLNQVIRRKELVNTFVSHEMRRSLYKRISTLLPDNPYVLQHRSILERELRNAPAAVDFAKEAVRLQPYNPAFNNTLGMALEFSARSVDDPLKWKALISEAEKIFDQGIQKSSDDAYGYIGKLHCLEQRINREQKPEQKTLLKANAYSLLEEAYEETEESPIIAGELAKARDNLGEKEDAIEVLKEAVAKKPTDSRLRMLWVRLVQEKGDAPDALKIASDGLAQDPTSWRLQRAIARIRRELGQPFESVRGFYEAAVRHNQADIGLKVEVAAFFFMSGRYGEASDMFYKLRQLSVPYQERNRVREVWKDSSGNERIFDGRVGRSSGAFGRIIAVPDNFVAGYYRTTRTLEELRENQAVRFKVRFSAKGASAAILPGK